MQDGSRWISCRWPIDLRSQALLESLENMLKEHLQQKGLSDMSPKRRFQRKWKINECKRQRAWKGGGREVWAGCQAVSLLSGPLGHSQQRLPSFCLRPEAGTELGPSHLLQTLLIMPYSFPFYAEASITIVTNWTINHSSHPHPRQIRPIHFCQICHQLVGDQQQGAGT